ncbi:MAG: sensor domain-containing diguanylate cyclase [Vicinamibacterales bacterium]
MPASRARAGATRPPTRLYDDSLAARLRTGSRACLARLNRRDTLADLIQAIQATLEPDQVATAVATRFSTWIPVTCWTVVAADVESQLFVLADLELPPHHAPTLSAVADWVMKHDRPFLSGNLQHDDRVIDGHAVAVLALPLRGRERVVGALIALDSGVSTAAPILPSALARAIGEVLRLAGLALDTALLLKRTEALSVTDDLTRLYNARYLNIALRRETRLATRNSRPLSLLFIDLDGFKSINDSHGHLAGSRALVEAGAVIRGSARETDIVARFGGDEFALILPDTGSPGALQVAERIRDRIARHVFLAGDGLNIHLTASVGAATLPDVAAAADELVQAADAAMYRVKDRGKNGIQAAASGR